MLAVHRRRRTEVATGLDRPCSCSPWPAVWTRRPEISLFRHARLKVPPDSQDRSPAEYRLEDCGRVSMAYDRNRRRERRQQQTHGFQAEVRELLQLMIHSLYSHQGNLPARADLQRLGCQRPAALRGHRQARRCWPRTPELEIWIDADAASRHAHDPRQRHRHDPRGGHRQPRHHRPLRHRRVLQVALRAISRRTRSSSASSASASTRPSSSPTASKCCSRKAGEPAEAGVRWESERRRRIHGRDRHARRSAAPPSCCT